MKIQQWIMMFLGLSAQFHNCGLILTWNRICMPLWQETRCYANLLLRPSVDDMIRTIIKGCKYDSDGVVIWQLAGEDWSGWRQRYIALHKKHTLEKTLWHLRQSKCTSQCVQTSSITHIAIHCTLKYVWTLDTGKWRTPHSQRLISVQQNRLSH